MTQTPPPRFGAQAVCNPDGSVIGAPAGGATEASLSALKTAAENLDADIGSPGQSPATSDDGEFSLTRLFKRHLVRLTLVLDRLPSALADGRLKVVDSNARGPGSVDSTTTRVTLAEGGPLNLATGGPADAAVVDPAANASQIAIGKGLLTQLAALLLRVPALVSNRIPVDHSGVIERGAGSVTPLTQRMVLATDGPTVTALNSIAGMAIPAHDHLALTYTSGNLTQVVYRTGGSGGTIVGTITLGYTGGVITSIARS